MGAPRLWWQGRVWAAPTEATPPPPSPATPPAVWVAAAGAAAVVALAGVFVAQLLRDSTTLPSRGRPSRMRGEVGTVVGGSGMDGDGGNR